MSSDQIGILLTVIQTALLGVQSFVILRQSKLMSMQTSIAETQGKIVQAQAEREERLFKIEAANVVFGKLCAKLDEGVIDLDMELKNLGAHSIEVLSSNIVLTNGPFNLNHKIDGLPMAMVMGKTTVPFSTKMRLTKVKEALDSIDGSVEVRCSINYRCVDDSVYDLTCVWVIHSWSKGEALTGSIASQTRVLLDTQLAR